jgi:hypothetical protein
MQMILTLKGRMSENFNSGTHRSGTKWHCTVCTLGVWRLCADGSSGVSTNTASGTVRENLGPVVFAPVLKRKSGLCPLTVELLSTQKKLAPFQIISLGSFWKTSIPLSFFLLWVKLLFGKPQRSIEPVVQHRLRLPSVPHRFCNAPHRSRFVPFTAYGMCRASRRSYYLGDNNCYIL